MKQKPIVPETCDADLEMRFGTPQQVAAAYVDAMSTQELLKALRQRRRVLTILIASGLEHCCFGLLPFASACMIIIKPIMGGAKQLSLNN